MDGRIHVQISPIQTTLFLGCLAVSKQADTRNIMWGDIKIKIIGPIAVLQSCFNASKNLNNLRDRTPCPNNGIVQDDNATYYNIHAFLEYSMK